MGMLTGLTVMDTMVWDIEATTGDKKWTSTTSDPSLPTLWRQLLPLFHEMWCWSSIPCGSYP